MIPTPKKLPKEITIQWRPQPRQATFLQACGLLGVLDGGQVEPPAARVLGYGGAAGGGKSDALLGCGIVAAFFVPGVSVGYFRRQYSDLAGSKGPVMRSHELLNRDWCHWDGEQHRWTFPNGSIIGFCHVKDEMDVYNYKSQQFDIVLIDEATQFTRDMYRYLLTRNRATVAGIVPFAALATNPGDMGHAWFKAEFADLRPEEPQEVEVEPGRFERHLFIPALLKDNEILERRDPGYRAILEGQSDLVRRQLLYGDWSAFAGQYFASWRPDVHIQRPPIDLRWWLLSTKNHKKFRCLDYGLDCTACYWIDIAPDGHLTVYRELYKPDLILSRATRSIVEATTDLENISYTVASPDLWNRRQDTGKSGLEILMEHGLTGLIPADDRRVAGWEHMAEWLEPYVDPETGKMASNLVFFDSCQNAIHQIPSLIRDVNNPSDVSDKAPDHAGEAIRYGLMSRPSPYVPDTSKRAEVESKWKGKPDAEMELKVWREFAEEDEEEGGLTFGDLGM